MLPNASSQHSGLWGWFEGAYSRAEATTEAAYKDVTGALDNGYHAASQAIEARYTVATDELRSWVDSIPDHIARATNWPELKYWAELALGHTSFNVGVGVGLVEGLAGAVVDIAKLAISLVKLQLKIWELQKTFILAGLYEQAHVDQAVGIALNPLTYPTARVANWLMGPQLAAADKQVRAMMEQLQRLLQHPSPDFKKLFNEMLSAMGRGKDSVVAGWKHYTELLKDSKPSAKFEAGVMTGKVLFEVIMLILMIISIYGAAAEAGTAIARVAGRFMARFAEEFPALYEFIVGARDVAEAERLAPVVRAAEVDRAAATEQAAAADRTVAEAQAAEKPSYRGKLRGEDVDLPDVETRKIAYTKRNPTATAALRQAFDRGGREDFLKYLGTDSERISDLKRAGFSDSEIADIAEGNVPDGWQVHHKLPLDDGGDNSFDNLVLIENDPYHKVITNAQRSLTSGLQVGQSKTIDFPVPDGYVYPPAPP